MRLCAAWALARCPRAGEEPREGSRIIGRPWWAASLGQEAAAEEARSLGGPAVQAVSRMPLRGTPVIFSFWAPLRPERWQHVYQVAALDPYFLTLCLPHRLSSSCLWGEGKATSPLLPEAAAPPEGIRVSSG